MTQRRSHVRRSQSQWREILTRYEVSGQSQRDFCRAEGLALATFLRWRRRLGSVSTARPVAEQSRAQPAVDPFVELGMSSEGRGWSIELELPDGFVLRVRP